MEVLVLTTVRSYVYSHATPQMWVRGGEGGSIFPLVAAPHSLLSLLPTGLGWGGAKGGETED